MDFQFSLQTESIEAAYPQEPLVVEPGTPLKEVLALLRNRNSGSVLICSDGVLEGIFTERDALKLMAIGVDLMIAIDQVMVSNPVTLQSVDSVATAIRKMSKGGYRRLPIVDDARRPLGIAVVSGIVHFIVEHFPETVYNLPPAPDPIMEEREGA